MKYEKFDIVEVALACGIQLHPIQRDPVEVKALCPFCNDTKYHLGLNREKERFYCFRCHEGGNSVSLYAKLHGLSNGEAAACLKKGFKSLAPNPIYVRRENEMPIKPLEERHNVYYDFLNLLRLRPAHRDNLLRRGLTFSQIHQFMYRSIPLDPIHRCEVLRELSARHDLTGIPGFYRDERGDFQMYFNRYGGIFIPVCNKDGYIQGLQMRLDLPESSTERKFRWFSSRHFKDGCGVKSWIHVVGDTTATEACLTEGPMKADVTSVLSKGRLFIAVPGVNAISQLPEVIQSLEVKRIYEAFDMDKRSKPEVRNALISLKETIRGMNVECVSCSWDPRFKGIDDYYLARKMYMEQAA